MVGRKETPNEIKRITGNPGRRPINDKEPNVRQVRSYREPPDYVREYPFAAETWEGTLPVLIEMGVLMTGDLASFGQYCIAVAMHREGVLVLAEEGPIYESVTEAGGIIKRKSPYVEIVNMNAKLAQSFAAEFGLTPSSRAKVKWNPAEDDNPLDEFLN